MGRSSISSRAGAWVVGACRAAAVAPILWLLAAGAARADALSAPTPAQPLNDLDALSISELTNTDVTSVTKGAQRLGAAPSAIYVITRDEILRSGAKRLPEMLRLAPNLFVAQTGANSYVITARGFSGNSAAESFSDNLLVLIDGRTVYNPIFAGVDWNRLNVLPEDIDRIEVISGPGATVWGSNAVNGVINVITRKSYETQGAVADVYAGNLEHGASLRYGGRINDDLTWRVYGMGVGESDTVTATGSKAQDHYSMAQGGFRVDWTPTGADALTVQGDGYHGDQVSNTSVAGANLLTRWNHSWENGSTLQVQAYYDRIQAGDDYGGGIPYWVNAYDLDVEQHFGLGPRNSIVVGGGVRLFDYSLGNTGNVIYFTPARRHLTLSNIFAEDTYALTSKLNLIVGLKLEDDPFSGAAPLPSVRLTWTPMPSLALWSAVSRAIRAPTAFDRDVQERVGGVLFLSGNKSFQPETVTAYETGLKAEPSAKLSVSISAYYNSYNDIRSVELSPGNTLPIIWAARIKGDDYGVESWGNYQATRWWRLSASLNLMNESFAFKPGASRLLGLAQVGDDPKTQAMLKSSITAAGLTFDADLRYVGDLPNPYVPAYVELNSRVGWNLTPHLQLAVSGFNLLHDRHQEFPAPQADAVPRSVFAEIRGRF